MKSIYTRLIVYFILISLIPLIIVGFFFYRNSITIYNDKVNNSLIKPLEQISSNIDSEMERLQACLDTIFASEQIHKILRVADFSVQNSQTLEAARDLDSLFDLCFYDDKQVISAFFIQEKGGIYSYKLTHRQYLTEWTKSSWHNDTLKLDGRINWIGSIKNPDTASENAHTFVIGRMIKDSSNKYNFNNNLGALYITLCEDFLSGSYKNLVIGEYGNIAVTDPQGKILSTLNKNMLSSNISSFTYMKTVLTGTKGFFRSDVDGLDLMVAYSTTPKYGYKIIYTMPYQLFVKDASRIKYVLFYLVLLSLVTIIIVSDYISKSITTPIYTLQNAMKSVENGNFSVNLITRQKDEVGKMISSFNYMVSRIDGLFHETIEGEKMKLAIEIKALQYQINPHFLYNVLASIRLSAMMNRDMEVAEMLQVLSRILSRTIGKAGTIITIASELENIQDFLYIQQIRYMGKIQVDYEIDEKILYYSIPNLLLQPIVENAVFHGFKARDPEPRVSLSGQMKQDRIVFTVSDNGAGMTPEQIENIMLGPENGEKKSFTGIGIKNINDRIKLIYGNGYGVEIHSQPGQGVTVMVTIPAVKDGLIEKGGMTA